MKAASTANPTTSALININSIDPTTNYTYSAPTFDITTAALPEIVATNATGYDIKFYPLQFTVIPLVGDVIANAVSDQNLTPNTWINL